jgi:tRNA-dihydrouridine synthase A
MGWTDRHDRYFMRLITPNTLLYTVMITTGALIHGKKLDVLDFSPEEHPLALQLGGSDPADLAACAKMAQERGYDEVNLNCGCPSERVQKGAFGACLMAAPHLVADCVEAMKQAVEIPVTVKTRIGIDDQDSYQFLQDFVGPIAEKGCDTFIIHARKAILGGLSPEENRRIPPLKYDTAYRLKQDFPHLNIILNGGITNIAQIKDALNKLDGVMIGREAYQNPYFMAEVEKEIFNNPNVPSREQITLRLIPYIQNNLQNNIPVKDTTRHILGLFQGLRGAKRWRQILSQNAPHPAANENVVLEALEAVRKLSTTG